MSIKKPYDGVSFEIEILNNIPVLQTTYLIIKLVQSGSVRNLNITWPQYISIYYALAKFYLKKSVAFIMFLTTWIFKNHLRV